MSGQINNQLFSAHEQALSHQSCPKCQHELVLKHGKRGPFLGCSQYPICDYIQSNQHDGHVVKELGVACPECAHELVLRQGRYGMFIGCSNYPECEHIESLHEPEPETSNAEGLICPECHQGQLVERNNRFGKVFYACDNYPKCKFAVNNPPVKGCCEKCGFELLVEKKTAHGIVQQCGDRKCHHVQSV